MAFFILWARVLADAIHWRYLRYHYEEGSIVEVSLWMRIKCP